MSRAHPAWPVAVLALAIAGCAATPPAPSAATDDERALALFERAFEEQLANEPTFATMLGLRTRYGEWPDASEAGQLERRDWAARTLQELRGTIDPARLDAPTRLSYEVFEDQLERRVARYTWRNHGFPFDQMGGLQSQTPAFLINNHRVESESDAEAYIQRLAGIRDYFATTLERVTRAEGRGVLPPKFVFPYVAEDARKVITGRPFDEGPADSPLYEDFKAKVAGLDVPEARRAALVVAAEQALVGAVGPAYEAVIAWAHGAQGRAGSDDGVWRLPHGAAYYEYLLANYTTTTLTAEDIHGTGLAEVERIHAQMRRIMRDVGFEGDLPAFFDFMRSDGRFYGSNDEAGRAAYLAQAAGYIDAMRRRLPDLFITLPRADVIVRAVEPFRERSVGKAFYQRGSPDGSRPAVFYVNLYEMRDMPLYELEALAYHEGIPGHHMQIAIAGEQQELPRFRRFGFGYSVYSEGWGLYSERLPREIGFYEDPYSDFGRLTMELLRAVRLVVDTGLHAKGWTREQVIRYHLDNTPLSEGAAVKATERYVVSPGQATAYTIGMLRIVAMRERARRELGGQFDLREFHDVILRTGAVPISVLERQVDDWIDSKRT